MELIERVNDVALRRWFFGFVGSKSSNMTDRQLDLTFSKLDSDTVLEKIRDSGDEDLQVRFFEALCDYIHPDRWDEEKNNKPSQFNLWKTSISLSNSQIASLLLEPEVLIKLAFVAATQPEKFEYVAVLKEQWQGKPNE
jgi:hypothetical protein